MIRALNPCNPFGVALFLVSALVPFTLVGCDYDHSVEIVQSLEGEVAMSVDRELTSLIEMDFSSGSLFLSQGLGDKITVSGALKFRGQNMEALTEASVQSKLRIQQEGKVARVSIEPPVEEGEVQADLIINVPQGINLSVSLSAGRVSVMSLVVPETVEIEVAAGEISLELPERSPAHVDLTVATGSIEVEGFGLEAERTQIVGAQCRGALNSELEGKGSLKARVEAGQINLRTQE